MLSPISATIVDHLRPVYVCHPSIYPVHLGPLSLAIPPWVGAMSTGSGFGHSWGRNGKFCIAEVSAVRTDGILA